jgi:hypothetical protein
VVGSVMKVPGDYCTIDKNRCDQVNSNSGYEFPEILTFREISPKLRTTKFSFHPKKQ